FCYGLILAVIWTPHPIQRFLFWIAFAWILITTLLRFPDANALGLRLTALGHSLWITCGGLVFAVVLVGIAREFHTLHPLQGAAPFGLHVAGRSEEHTSELQSLAYLVCRLLLEKKK